MAKKKVAEVGLVLFEDNSVVSAVSGDWRDVARLILGMISAHPELAAAVEELKSEGGVKAVEILHECNSADCDECSQRLPEGVY